MGNLEGTARCQPTSVQPYDNCLLGRAAGAQQKNDSQPKHHAKMAVSTPLVDGWMRACVNLTFIARSTGTHLGNLGVTLRGLRAPQVYGQPQALVLVAAIPYPPAPASMSYQKRNAKDAESEQNSTHNLHLTPETSLPRTLRRRSGTKLALQ